VELVVALVQQDPQVQLILVAVEAVEVRTDLAVSIVVVMAVAAFVLYVIQILTQMQQLQVHHHIPTPVDIRYIPLLVLVALDSKRTIWHILLNLMKITKSFV
jgi:hypothetical protein